MVRLAELGALVDELRALGCVVSVSVSIAVDAESMVEVGGQVMTEAQFDAARFPLLHPDPGPIDATSP